MPNYPRKIKLADSRRAKYFRVGEKFPDKYRKKILSGDIIYKDRKKNESCLYDTETNTFVLKNPKVAGTERWEVINGQKIYNSLYHPATRAKIMELIHKFMTPFLISLEITRFPLYIECEVHDLREDPISKYKAFDIYNRGFPYCKAFEDVLQELKIIPEDNVDYIICPSHPIFFPIPPIDIPNDISHLVPKLVFNIYHIFPYLQDGNNS